jgi:hypothetical protein
MLRRTTLIVGLALSFVIACGGKAASIGGGGNPDDNVGSGTGTGTHTGSDTGGGNNDHEQDDLKDAGHVDASDVTTPCGKQFCTHGDACVVTTSGGGPCMPPGDNGLCPDGLPPDGSCCNRMTTTTECKPVPAACGGVLACPCAESLCQCGGCSLAAEPNTLSCGCFYP